MKRPAAPEPTIWSGEADDAACHCGEAVDRERGERAGLRCARRVQASSQSATMKASVWALCVFGGRVVGDYHPTALGRDPR
jgi:hypothetical protein